MFVNLLVEPADYFANTAVKRFRWVKLFASSRAAGKRHTTHEPRTADRNLVGQRHANRGVSAFASPSRFGDRFVRQ